MKDRVLRCARPLCALLFAVAASHAAAAQSSWPPKGPKFLTDPSKAFAEARKEKQAVMAYVATAGCVHCVEMARATWPQAEIQQASKRIVFLAVDRERDTDWTVRLNVIAYPQIVFLDEWGAVLPNGRDHVYARTKDEVLTAIEAFTAHQPGPEPELHLGDELAKAVASSRVPSLTNTDQDVRAAAWRRVLPSLGPQELAALYDWEIDPVVRLEAIRAMRKKLERAKQGKQAQAVSELAHRAVGDRNDYVLQEALALLGDLGDKAAAVALAKVVTSVLADDSDYANPNNLLCAAVEASGQIADPESINALAQVLKQEQANNNATHLAVAALAAIGKKHGRALVRPALALALEVEGLGAERLHAAARNAMK